MSSMVGNVTRDKNETMISISLKSTLPGILIHVFASVTRIVTSSNIYTAQKMKFSIKDFFSKCYYLLKKSLMENFIFCGVLNDYECMKSHVDDLVVTCDGWRVHRKMQ